MAARGEAVGGEDAERLEAERHARVSAPDSAAPSAVTPAATDEQSTRRR